MNIKTTTGEYMLLFRGPHWDKGLSPEELQQAMNKVMAWFEALSKGGKVKASQPLGAQGRIISGRSDGMVSDGPFAESKEAVGGYLVLLADGRIAGEERRKLKDISAALQISEIHFGAILEDLAVWLAAQKT